MLITDDLAKKVRVKRAIEKMTKKELSLVLMVTQHTVAKIENGEYDAPKRIYDCVMDWLNEEQ